MKSWTPDERLPPMTLRTALTHYLDVTTPPPQTVLKQLAAIATDDNQRKALEYLATVGSCFRLNVEEKIIFFGNLVHYCFLWVITPHDARTTSPNSLFTKPTTIQETMEVIW